MLLSYRQLTFSSTCGLRFWLLRSDNLTRSPYLSRGLVLLIGLLIFNRYSALRLQFRKITSFQTKSAIKSVCVLSTVARVSKSYPRITAQSFISYISNSTFQHIRPCLFDPNELGSCSPGLGFGRHEPRWTTSCRRLCKSGCCDTHSLDLSWLTPKLSTLIVWVYDGDRGVPLSYASWVSG